MRYLFCLSMLEDEFGIMLKKFFVNLEQGFKIFQNF